jgi:hypothetical protein
MKRGFGKGIMDIPLEAFFFILTQPSFPLFIENIHHGQPSVDFPGLEYLLDGLAIESHS